jgi:chromosome segregation ATPase
MKGLSDEAIAQIDDVPKLQSLLSGVVQKNATQLKRLRAFQRQLRSAKSDLQSLSSAYATLKVENEFDQLIRFERDLEKVRADFNEFSFTELFEIIQNQGFEDAAFFQTQVARYEREFAKIQQERQSHIDHLLASKDEEIRQQKQKIDQLRSEIESQNSVTLSKDIERAISEKDQAITKLRAGVQKCVQTDQQRQQQIEEQQRHIERLSSLLLDAQRRTRGTSIEEVAKRERECLELKAELTNSQSSRQLEAKCEKLAAMLDRSNRLFDSLNEKYQGVCKQLGRYRPMLAVAQSWAFEQVSITAPEMQQNPAGDREAVALASLKKAVLQYFLRDVGNQEHLVPVILELVGCAPEQVRAAVRKVKSNQQMVSRARSVFGWFG